MKTLLTVPLAMVLLCGAGTVQAAPLAPFAPGIPSDLVLVAEGCGVGFHRGPNGVCRPQAKGPALMRIFARKCPVGYRRNLLGKCRRE
jgi:hypothetical protein